MMQSNLKKPPPLLEDARKLLADIYGEDIENLETLIGMDLSKWSIDSEN